MNSRPLCNACYRPNAAPFSVPDDVWQYCVPAGLQRAELCLTCFAAMADEKLCLWCDAIDVRPISRVGWEQSRRESIRLATETVEFNTEEAGV